MSDPPTAKSLSQLISQVLQFQEDHLGKGVKSPPFARIPLRHFLNFLPDGPLCRDDDRDELEIRYLAVRIHEIGEIK